ncbi:non-ribosomal peptide synthetase [Streptomyces iconiensis]|uniref:Non-ribosomal peptide synthetase n=1 Tax=Streptomyces iconiensis TaxID=1384038 RepID=A0ABT6ZQT0_9ACTN|nr:non-ribosomal peptide synthetase [Streptomyces iconiensis]MDJ1131415.1 non-ribosomal peptide synthetase [Streptomyces iconiensis]
MNARTVRTADDPQAAPLSTACGPPLPPPPAPGESPLDWYSSWARASPDAPAVDWGAAAWTYGQLDAASEQLSQALHDRVRPGGVVGACLDRSPALVALAVATARLGAVYLPLGADPPPARVAALAARLPFAALVTPRGSPAPLPGGTGRRVALPPPAFPELEVRLFHDGEGAQRTRTACAGAYYAVLTSGSTGRPHAVGVGHASLGALLRWAGAEYAIGPGTRMGLFVRPGFDPHLLELWSALAHGAALCVPPRDAVPESVSELFDWWRTARVTHTIVPTPLAELVFSARWPRGLAMRHLFTGGDRLSAWPPRDVTATVHNHYGPAEGTVLSVSHPLLRRADQAGGQAPPIGSPIGGVVVGVIGPDGRLVPRGQPGELVLGGTGLSLGYLGQPELTAERFTAPPPGMGDGTRAAHRVDRVYRTGDRVRMREDGVLDFLGRLDLQVKASGVRVEPAEVEAALERAPGVRRAVVVAPPGGGGQRLVAFVCPAPGAAPPAESELLQLCRDLVPEPAVPARVRFIDELPHTPNGKVDRAALSRDATTRDATTGAAPPHMAPSHADQQDQQDKGEEGDEGDTLRFLADTCVRLLGVTAVRPTDNFLALGGNSLTAMRLVSAVESVYRLNLRVTQVLRQPDLASLARYIEQESERAG